MRPEMQSCELAFGLLREEVTPVGSALPSPCESPCPGQPILACSVRTLPALKNLLLV